MNELLIPVGVSNRHVHLSQPDMDILFGSGYTLNIYKELKQKGQYATKERVNIKGPKSEIKGVRVLYPLRSQTQVELSRTDAIKLGVKPCVRQSGDLTLSPGAEVIGPKGKLQLNEGVIVAARHIHISDKMADKYSLHDRQLIDIQVPGERALIFHNVIVRISPLFDLEFHIDTDEANAAELNHGNLVRVI